MSVIYNCQKCYQDPCMCEHYEDMTADQLVDFILTEVLVQHSDRIKQEVLSILNARLVNNEHKE
jgi:dsRNA-specific ribonuclease